VFSGLTLASGVIDNVVPHPFAGNPTYLALYVNALTFLVSGLVIWRLEFPRTTSHTERQESVLRTAVEGWAYIGRTPLVRGLVLGMLGAFAAGGFVIGLAQNFVYDLGAGAPGYGTLFAAVFIGMAAGMWVAPRLLADFSRRRLFGLAIATAGVWLVLMSVVPNIVLAVFFTVGLGTSAGAAWVTGYTLLGLEVGDDVRGRTFAFVQAMVRVVLISVLAIGPVVAAGFSKGLGLPHTVHLTDDVALTYTGVMATFLLAGLGAAAVGVVAYRQMDDRPQVSLAADLISAVRQRRLQDAPARRGAYAGRFIAFEGGDGAGKSTQVRLLGEWLAAQGYDAVLTREPGATQAGERIREVLLHGGDLVPRAEALLFAADRAHHVETVIRPALDAGKVVVTDRYSDSSVAYQGGGRDLGTAEVAQLSRWATQGLVPDLTVVLDVGPDVGRERRGDEHDRLEAEPEDFHRTVRERFLDLARRAPSRYLVVDAGLSTVEVHDRVVTRLADVLPESPVARAAREQREQEERLARAAAEEERLAREAAEEQARRAAEQERLAAEAAAAEQAAAERALLEAEERARAQAQEQERRELEERAREAEREASRARAAQVAEQERARQEAAAAETAAAEAAEAEAAAHAHAETTAMPAVDVTAPLPVVDGRPGPATEPVPSPAPRAHRRGHEGQHLERREAPRERARDTTDDDARAAADGSSHDVRLEDEIFGLGESDHR
jgi:dTMP kinase